VHGHVPGWGQLRRRIRPLSNSGESVPAAASAAPPGQRTPRRRSTSPSLRAGHSPR
jgi:hypothetical protein